MPVTRVVTASERRRLPRSSSASFDFANSSSERMRVSSPGWVPAEKNGGNEIGLEALNVRPKAACLVRVRARSHLATLCADEDGPAAAPGGADAGLPHRVGGWARARRWH